jgi:hypothetical protein
VLQERAELLQKLQVALQKSAAEGICSMAGVGTAKLADQAGDDGTAAGEVIAALTSQLQDNLRDQVSHGQQLRTAFCAWTRLTYRDT